MLPVLLALLGAAVLIALRRARLYRAGIAVAIVGAIALADAQLLARTLAEGPVSTTFGGWAPPFGISFSADVLGASFALAAAVATLFVVLYEEGATVEVHADFAPLVLLLLAGVSGAFLTGDLFNLYVWFEVLLVASFGLLVLRAEPLQLEATVKYGFLNLLGTTIFLAGLGLIYGLSGTLNMADLTLRLPEAPVAPLTAIAALFVLAFGLKAAVFPFNAWLPASYHAPSAGTAALFAGLLTKVGVYALLRVLVMVLPGPRAVLEPLIAALAVGTLLIGPFGAIAETNLRRVAGYLLIGGIGSALAGIALATEQGLAGAGLYGLTAMVTMTALYLVIGLIERGIGASDTRAMGGIYERSRLLWLLFLALVLSLAGAPPFLGFWPKLLLLDAAIERSMLLVSTTPLDLNYWAFALLLALLLNAVLTLIAGTRAFAHVFWRAAVERQGLGRGPSGLASGRPLLAMGTVALLTMGIVAVGLLPEGLLSMALRAGSELLDPAPYIASVGLGEFP